MRAMHNYVHVIRLHLKREGSSASALFVSPEEEDYRPLIALATTMGIEAEVEADPAPLCKVDGVIEWMRQFNREQTPEPAVERGEYEARLNELTRAQRNTDRKLDMIAGMLGELLGNGKPSATRVNELQDKYVASTQEQPTVGGRKIGVPVDSVPPATDEQLQEQLDRPTPFFEHGEPEMKDAHRAVGNQYTGTAGVLPGNMPPSVSSSSQVFGVGTDASGKLAAIPVALPKVGDSLIPPSMRRTE